MVLEIARIVTDDRLSFEVNASDIYPMMVFNIKSMIDQGLYRYKLLFEQRGLMNETIFQMYVPTAIRLEPIAWKLALMSPERVEGYLHGDSVDTGVLGVVERDERDRISQINSTHMQMRAQALEIARLWFTELLHESVGYKPMRLRIKADKNRTFRLE